VSDDGAGCVDVKASPRSGLQKVCEWVEVGGNERTRGVKRQPFRSLRLPDLPEQHIDGGRQTRCLLRIFCCKREEYVTDNFSCSECGIYRCAEIHKFLEKIVGLVQVQWLNL